MSVPGTPAPSGSTPHDTVDPTGGEQDSLVSGRIRAMVRRMLHNGFPVAASFASMLRVTDLATFLNTIRAQSTAAKTATGEFARFMTAEGVGSAAGIVFTQVGAVAQANRKVVLQTQDESGAVNAGILALQGFGGSVTCPIEAETTVTAFANSWAAFGGGTGAPRFSKDPFGVVHLAGLLASGVLNGVAFNMPVGYRPTVLFIGAAASLSGGVQVHGEIRVDTFGSLTPVAGGTTYISLDGLSYRTT